MKIILLSTNTTSKGLLQGLKKYSYTLGKVIAKSWNCARKSFSLLHHCEHDRGGFAEDAFIN